MCSPVKESEFTLNQMHSSYNELFDEDDRISCKCIHNQLTKDKVLLTVKTIAQECMALFNTDSFKQKVRSKLPCDLNSLCKSLKVDAILLVDGTEIDLNYLCADNFHCKGKGRDSKDGDKARPGLKLHVIFSVKFMTFVQIKITEAVGDERECVHPDNFKNVLFITDRGYVSEKLEQSIEESGNLFLIRGKSNSDSTIKKAFLDNGKEASQFEGKKVSELPHDISPEWMLPISVTTVSD